MATLRNHVAPVPPAVHLCDYCHQKAKFSNHAYCSKTCATQAATLCNHCHKKPKFQNFEYCGKNCAALANPAGVKVAAPRTVGAGAHGTNVPQARAGGAVQKQQQFHQQQPAFDPLQIAKLVVQQMPQVQALLNGSNGNYQSAQASNGFYPGQQPNVNPAVNNPFLNPVNSGPNTLSQQQQPQQHTLGLGLVQPNNVLHLSCQQQSPDDLECVIPGCRKPVHVDAKGLKTSDYCSQRHREEAVATGLVSPCIMCLTRPQSHTDYFCGRACREESLNKHYTVDEEEVAGAVREDDDGNDPVSPGLN